MAHKRIAIDARMAGVEQRGIGRMVLGFLQNLENAVGAQDFVPLQDLHIDILLRKANFNCVEFKDSRIRKVVADYHWYGWREQIQYLFFLLRKRYDLVFFTHFNMPLLYFRPYAVFIHDLQMIQWKDERQSTKTGLVYHMKHQVLRILMWKAVRFAKKIIVPSKTVKRDLLEYYFPTVIPDALDLIGGRGSKNEKQKELKSFGFLDSRRSLPRTLIRGGNDRGNGGNDKITVVYEGVVWSEPEYDDSVLEKYKLFFERTPHNAGEVEKFTHVNLSTSSKNIVPYILYVGAFYLHKNVKTLVEAFNYIFEHTPPFGYHSREGNQKSPPTEGSRSDGRLGDAQDQPKAGVGGNFSLKLVLVGKLDYFGEKLKEFVELSKIQNVIFTGFLPDVQLNSLYRNCALYVHPSLSEGFNLSPMEAMRAGARKVLISDIPVNREIYGSRVPTVDCRTSERLAQAIRIQLNSNTTPVDIDYFRRTYSFEKMAREIWGLLMEEKVG